MTDDLLHDLLTAERGSRELDVRFWCASNGLTGEIEYGEDEGAGRQWFTCGRVCQFMDELPRYTTNMQDTIEAVPEGHEWSVGRAAGCGRANVWVPNPLRSVNIPTSPTKAATPQLALSAAILKAKGAQDGS